MTDKDIKKIASVVKLVVEKQLEDFEDDLYEKIRKIVRSELDYKLDNTTTSKKVLHDEYPSEDKMNEIKQTSTGSSQDYVAPSDMIKKLKKLNEEAHDPEKDIYVDDQGTPKDMSNEPKLKSFQKRDYSNIVG